MASESTINDGDNQIFWFNGLWYINASIFINGDIIRRYIYIVKLSLFIYTYLTYINYIYSESATRLIIEYSLSAKCYNNIEVLFCLYHIVPGAFIYI